MTLGQHVSIAGSVLMLVGMYVNLYLQLAGFVVFLLALQIQITELRTQLEKTPKP